ncbi:hypothetical protein CK203_061898 [Vitis vinifera]|uniref:Uncharacterized protein n=1 Tax=Vitis vinifera TaxID=29760 RepID=A0A438GCM0_VITVI|nr:hypothetical protein CK203_061898 [Vitis vinifera]
MESCASNIRSLLGHGDSIGCGVGWGPGFGPEVIGYVELVVVLDLVLASLWLVLVLVFLQIALLKFLIMVHVPAFLCNCFILVPSSFIATRNGALEFTRMSGLLSMGNAAGDGLNTLYHTSLVCKEKPVAGSSSFKGRHTLNKGVDLCDSKSLMLHSRSILERIRTSGCSFFHGRRGMLMSPWNF